MNVLYATVSTMKNTKQKTKRKSKYDILPYDLRPKRSKAGIGLYTFSPIKKGACIIEYVGKILTEKEEYNSNSLYLFEVTKKVTLDGRPKFNKAGYINHSCRPNAEVEIYKRRVYVMARRNIKVGEEITYDYGMEYWKEHVKPKGCKCEKCMGK